MKFSLRKHSSYLLSFLFAGIAAPFGALAVVASTNPAASGVLFSSASFRIAPQVSAAPAFGFSPGAMLPGAIVR